uniref:Uncharacterized protein n=1 Tax=Rhizophora mucronata TaxID=61149 RepID=A0A2P2L9K8_RHIMU
MTRVCIIQERITATKILSLGICHQFHVLTYIVRFLWISIHKDGIIAVHTWFGSCINLIFLVHIGGVSECSFSRLPMLSIFISIIFFMSK